MLKVVWQTFCVPVRSDYIIVVNASLVMVVGDIVWFA